MSSDTPKSGADGNTLGEFFKPDDKIKSALTPLKVQDSNKIILNNIESVFLVATDNVMVALTELGFSDSSGEDKNKEIILAKYVETNEDNWGKEAVQKDKNDRWDAIATKEEKKESSKAPIKSFAAVATKDKKIYHITFSNDLFKKTPQGSELSDSSAKWQLRLVEGTVTNSGSNGKKKLVLTSSIISVLKEESKLDQLKTEPAQSTLSDGFAFVTDDNNIFFIIKSKITDGDTNVNALFHLEKKTNRETFELLSVVKIENCHPSFLQWGKEIIMTPTDESKCENNKVMVFDKEKKTFTERNTPISYLKDFLKNKKHFTTANVQETNVLLFTQQETKSKNNGKNNVCLWMTDGIRARNVGNIFDTKFDGEDTFYGSILHTNGELFVLHQTVKAGSNPPKENQFSLTRLTDQLNNIKTTLIAWNKNGEKIKDFYKINDPTTNLWYTNGLVGFLSDTVSDDNRMWHDKYHYVNAIVTNGEKAPDGITLKGGNGKATWSVGETEKDQPYNFIDFGLTLVATVKIDKHNKENGNSLLGVVLKKEKNNNKRVGLFCSKDKTWVVKIGESDANSKIKQKKCDEGKFYVVTFVLQAKRKIEIYIDEEQLAVLDNDEITVSTTIKEFYFGAEGNTQPATSDITITNVLLYNRLLAGNEIKQFKPEQSAEAGTQAIHGNDDSKTPNPGKNEIETDTSTTENKKQAQSSTTIEDSAVCVGVYKLLFLFVLFVLLSPCVHVLF